MSPKRTENPLQGKRLAIIGAGNMGEALLRGLLCSKAVPPEHVSVSDCSDARRAHVSSMYSVAARSDNASLVKDADVVVLAVKPQVIASALGDVASLLPASSMVVSIAAGVTIATLEAGLPGGAHVCRAMPNTPALVGAAVTALAGGSCSSREDFECARALFQCVGAVVEVEEGQLDAVTGLSGSGPAYVFVIIEALADAGVRVGLSRQQAQFLATQTVLGSAKMLAETGQHPAVLKDQVTSPGGTTIAGLHMLERGGVRAALYDAVYAAVARSRELGAKKA